MNLENKTSIAVVGCGGWGKNHLRNWDEIGVLEAACDTSPSIRKKVHKNYPDIEVYSKFDDLLDESQVDALVIATPAPTHFDLVKKALKQDKHVLVEKPMAMNQQEGETLRDLSREKNKVLQVGHLLEYHPAFVKLHELVEQGDLGKIQYIYANRLNFGRIRTHGSALWSFAPHDLSMILRLLGTMPEEVTCSGEAYISDKVSDVTLTTLSFPGKIRAHIFVSWLHPFKEHRFTVIGEDKMAVFDDTKPWDDKLTLYPHSVNWVEGQIPEASKAEGETVAFEKGEPLKLECEHFLECIRDDKTPKTDAESGIKVLKLLDSAESSLENGSEKHEVEPPDEPPEETEPLESRQFFAHSTATIDDGADIGEDSKIWHYSHVMSEADIGKNCILGQNVFVGNHTSIGNNVKVQNNVSVYEGVILEDNVFCGPSMVFTNVINPRSEIERKDEFQETLVKEGATLGANCTILCGTTIGKYAMVGAGAVVTKDVPDNAIVTGNPASISGWVCECGETLSFENGTANCSSCDFTYKQLSDQQVKPV